MAFRNGKLKWNIISVCFTIFWAITIWITGYATKEANTARAEQKVIDDFENHTNKIKQNQYELLQLENKSIEQNKKINKNIRNIAITQNDIQYIKKTTEEIKGDVKEILRKLEGN